MFFRNKKGYEKSDEVARLPGKWGVCPWCREDMPYLPDDPEIQVGSSEVYECVNENDECITLKSGNHLFKVKKDIFKEVPSPRFQFGQKVNIKEKNVEAIIIGIMWHWKKKEHYYYVSINGKKKSRRYFEFELVLGNNEEPGAEDFKVE